MVGEFCEFDRSYVRSSYVLNPVADAMNRRSTPAERSTRAVPSSKPRAARAPSSTLLVWAHTSWPQDSGYSASKLAVIKFGEFLDVEQPKLRVFSVHPGMVEAEGGRGMVVEPFLPFSKDKAALTGGLSVYLTTPKADFLKGGYLHANWDVEELEKHKDEITEKKLTKFGFLNAQLQPGADPWSA